MAKNPLITDAILRMFPEQREFQRFLLDLSGIGTDTASKANKVVLGVEDNIVTLQADGDIQDSGKSFADIQLKQTTTRTITVSEPVQFDDELLWVDASLGDVTLTALNAVTVKDRTLIIQKIDSSANKVIFSASSLVNGATTFELLSQYESIKPTSTGSTYIV